MVLRESPMLPPTDGTILLSDTLAFHGRNNADTPVYLFMEDDAEDMTQITYGQFGRACRRASRAIGTTIDPESSTRPVVAVIALVDTLVYQTIVMGAMVAGLVPFPISPRNTAPAIVNLLRVTSCHSIIATCATLKDLIKDVQQELERVNSAHKLTIKEAPTLYELFPGLLDKYDFQDCETELPCPSTFDFKPKVDDVALYLHSSGSTGYPKAIAKTHSNILEYVMAPCCAIFRNRKERPRMPGMQLPPFHALGIVVEVFMPLFCGVSVVFFPPVVKSPDLVPTLTTPENVIHHVKRTKCNALVIIPAFLQVWANEAESVVILRGLETVIYSGGGVSQKLGDFLVGNGVVLQSVYGGTEAGGPAFSSQRAGDEKEWEYVEFSDKCNPRWVDQGDETYECHLITTPTHHLSVHNLPDVEGFATSDLFKRHPRKAYLWKIVGRLDDVIIHSSGEKTVPPPLEGIMMSSPHIKGVAMFGNGHDRAGVLIEPSRAYEIDVADMKQVAQFLNLIWPVVDEANQIAPAFSKIFKETILITGRQNPLPRAPKGTVIRKLALSAYAAEIEALYRRIESAQGAELIDPPRQWDEECLIEWLLRQVREVCPGKVLSTSHSLFEQEVDSLSATILRRRIIGALQSTSSSAQHIALNVVYRYPTVEGLADHILSLLDGPVPIDFPVEAHTREIEEMIRKYEFSSPAIASFHSPRSTSVLLTGSTGHLGSEILEGLLLDPRISKVYTLNRPSIQGGPSIVERHVERFRDQGLDEQLLKSRKLVYLEADTSAERLGLSDCTYSELRDCVTVVIHVAWTLDFNRPLGSFEPHIRGTHNLLALARGAPHAATIKLIFTSSVSTAQAWDRSAGPYPEELVVDARFAVGMGYGESKYVAERIIASSGLNATSLRIGQISGSRNGAWAPSDWVPILVKSGIALGCLPRAHGSVSWLPMATAAACVLDLAWLDGRYPAALNVVHPRRVAWDAVMENIEGAVRRVRGTPLPLVPFKKWFDLLERRAAMVTSEEMVNIPGIKLLDFFRHLCSGDLHEAVQGTEAFGIAGFATAKAEAMSRALADVPPLAPADAERWVAYWSTCGFIDHRAVGVVGSK